MNSKGPQNSVILIGTVHLDFEASMVLHELLETLRPACITVEISSFSVRYRSRMEGVWLHRFLEIVRALPVPKRGHLKLELLKRQISMPFEWSTAEGYASKAGIQVVPVDSGALSKIELPSWKGELLSLENMEFLASLEDEPSESYFSRHYARARHILREPERIQGGMHPLVFDENWCKREELLARRVKNLSRVFRPLVHIGGWMHLIRAPSQVTLASLVERGEAARFLVTRERVFEIG